MICTHYHEGTRCKNIGDYAIRFEYKMQGGNRCEACARSMLDEYAAKLDDGWKWDAVPVSFDGFQVQGHAPNFHEVLRGKAYNPPKKHATHEEWKSSHLRLSTYLSVGDTVDEAFEIWWVSVLPPATWSKTCIQIGEAAGADERGRTTFSTLQRFEDGGPWVYMGEIATPAGERCSYE